MLACVCVCSLRFWPLRTPRPKTQGATCTPTRASQRCGQALVARAAHTDTPRFQRGRVSSFFACGASPIAHRVCGSWREAPNQNAHTHMGAHTNARRKRHLRQSVAPPQTIAPQSSTGRACAVGYVCRCPPPTKDTHTTLTQHTWDDDAMPSAKPLWPMQPTQISAQG